MTLQSWCTKNHWLEVHTATEDEILNLIEGAERNIEQACLTGIQPGWRFRMAYEAILNCARAALYKSGYRVDRRGGGHFREIASLELTLEVEPDTISLLDAYRMRRNQVVYEGIDLTSDNEAREALEEAEKLLQRLRIWLEV